MRRFLAGWPGTGAATTGWRDSWRRVLLSNRCWFATSGAAALSQMRQAAERGVAFPLTPETCLPGSNPVYNARYTGTCPRTYCGCLIRSGRAIFRESPASKFPSAITISTESGVEAGATSGVQADAVCSGAALLHGKLPLHGVSETLSCAGRTSCQRVRTWPALAPVGHFWGRRRKVCAMRSVPHAASSFPLFFLSVFFSLLVPFFFHPLTRSQGPVWPAPLLFVAAPKAKQDTDLQIWLDLWRGTMQFYQSSFSPLPAAGG